MFTSIKGYEDLSDQQKKILETVQPKHYLGWGTEKRKSFTIDKIKYVKPGETNDIVEVYYEDDWYHYDSKGTWY